jgi:hypothetical protein
MIVDMKANGEESADGRVISVASISGYWSNDGVRYQLVRRWDRDDIAIRFAASRGAVNNSGDGGLFRNFKRLPHAANEAALYRLVGRCSPAIWRRSTWLLMPKWPLMNRLTVLASE